ncbi:MAG: CvpA family protein [Firmicutes bacterium]|nr:CvpA family protein [Bacillota bacterium]
MNLLDFAVLGVMILYCIRGMSKGLVLSVFDIASFFVAAFGAGKFYPVVSDMIMKTSIYESLKEGIGESLFKNAQPIVQTTAPGIAETTTAVSETNVGVMQDTVQSVIDSLLLPQSIKTALIDMKNFDINSLLDVQGMIEQLSGNISVIIVNIISVILIFMAIKLILFIVGSTLDQFMKLPVLNEMNKLGGGIFGVVNGLIIIYIVFAILTLFAPIQASAPLIEMINESSIAKIFYNHNILLNWILQIN